MQYRFVYGPLSGRPPPAAGRRRGEAGDGRRWSPSCRGGGRRGRASPGRRSPAGTGPGPGGNCPPAEGPTGWSRPTGPFAGTAAGMTVGFICIEEGPGTRQKRVCPYVGADIVRPRAHSAPLQIVPILLTVIKCAVGHSHCLPAPPPHPPQCAHWGTFPPEGGRLALRGTGEPCMMCRMVSPGQNLKTA